MFTSTVSVVGFRIQEFKGIQQKTTEKVHKNTQNPVLLVLVASVEPLWTSRPSKGCGRHGATERDALIGRGLGGVQQVLLIGRWVESRQRITPGAFWVKTPH